MLSLNDINIIECDDDGSDEAYYLALQRAINSGAWGLQGSYGRAMMAAIEEGRCMLGKQPARDYYGSFIPSRDQVKVGSKGSYEFVAEQVGVEWADMMFAA